MKNFIDYDKLQRLSEADKDVPLYKKIIKLQEECGEEFLNRDYINVIEYKKGN